MNAGKLEAAQRAVRISTKAPAHHVVNVTMWGLVDYRLRDQIEFLSDVELKEQDRKQSTPEIRRRVSVSEGAKRGISVRSIGGRFEIIALLG